MKKFISASHSCVTLCLALFLSLPSQAALISVSSYTYNTSPHSSYSDSGGELTDGITDNIAWGEGVTIGYSDVSNLTGWNGVNPNVTFNFATAQLIKSIRVFAADSDGYAGVALPDTITVSTVEGFSQLFTITNPPGNGSTIALDLSGFATTSGAFTLTMVRSSSWTMLSEVQFFSNDIAPVDNVPEPKMGLLLLLGLAFIRRKQLSK
ncbi:MAG: hypothetical protein HWE26_07040 [Alteromonadaceae bacterium]|nr:hypothetical protein [Alteromonadaceae bacterium]